MSERISKALGHYELATSYLAVALNIFTKELEQLDSDGCYLAMSCAEFLSSVQPILKKLCDEGCYEMPRESLEVLRRTDPETFREVTEALKERN